MNVAELRELLGRFPADLPVWHDGGGDPYCAGEITAADIEESLGRVMYGHEHDTPQRWLELS